MRAAIPFHDVRNHLAVQRGLDAFLVDQPVPNALVVTLQWRQLARQILDHETAHRPLARHLVAAGVQPRNLVEHAAFIQRHLEIAAIALEQLITHLAQIRAETLIDTLLNALRFPPDHRLIHTKNFAVVGEDILIPGIVADFSHDRRSLWLTIVIAMKRNLYW
ncbi:hypothetical protein [Nitrosomonas sp. wSCUT-2]